MHMFHQCDKLVAFCCLQAANQRLSATAVFLVSTGFFLVLLVSTGFFSVFLVSTGVYKSPPVFINPHRYL